MNALLLAAGLGERLRPISEQIPKPLLPIVNQQLIDIGIRFLLSSGINTIGINLHNRHDVITDHLQKYQEKVKIVVEPELLGTGGALRNFQELLKDDFILYSHDVVSDIRLQQVIEFHKKHKPVATLVLIKDHGIEFQMEKDNRITKIFRRDGHANTYAGISIFSKEVFSFLPQKPVFSIVDVFKNILNKKEKLMGLPGKMQWYNINSPYSYWKIHHDLLKGLVSFDGLQFAEPIYIAPSSKVQTDALNGFVSINEDCIIAKNVYLENAIVLPRSRIGTGNFRNCVLGSRLRITVA
jgi:mannose-1-phosphate guanylyltransferase